MDLAKADKSQLSHYLKQRSLIENSTSVEKCLPAGPGNMNITLRVLLDNQTSLILKQSPPYVAKYPHLAAPERRFEIEARFYEAAIGSPIANQMPKLLHVDDENRLLVLEDLGSCRDLSEAYQAKAISESNARTLIQFLNALHQIQTAPILNRSMRELNHQHIFVIPFESPVEVSLALRALWEEKLNSKNIRTTVERLGQKYMEPGGTLLHGDYYPGSWLTNGEDLYVIDPEFAFHGCCEFELGVFMAHLVFSGWAPSKAEALLSHYQHTYKKHLVNQFASVEILRRIYGVAQLPITENPDWVKWAVEQL